MQSFVNYRCRLLSVSVDHGSGTALFLLVLITSHEAGFFVCLKLFAFSDRDREKEKMYAPIDYFSPQMPIKILQYSAGG